jgi:hypothetical protein
VRSLFAWCRSHRLQCAGFVLTLPFLLMLAAAVLAALSRPTRLGPGQEVILINGDPGPVSRGRVWVGYLEEPGAKPLMVPEGVGTRGVVVRTIGDTSAVVQFPDRLWPAIIMREKLAPAR